MALSGDERFALAYGEAELADRQATDPLRLFQPHAKQQLFIDAVLRNIYWENWFVAANRCLTPWTVIETDSSTRQLAEMIGEPGFYVPSWDGVSRCTKKAGRVFLKGIEPALQLYLDNGEVVQCSYKHRVWTHEGWIAVGQLVSSGGGQHWWETDGDCLANYGTANHPYDRQPLQTLDSGQALLPSQGDAQQDVLDFEPQDARGPTPECIHACLMSFLHAIPDDPHRLAALCALWNSHALDTTCVYCPQRSPDDPLCGAVSILGQSAIRGQQHEWRHSSWLRSHASDTTAESFYHLPENGLQSSLQTIPAPAVEQCLKPQNLYGVHTLLPSPVLLFGGIQLIGYQKIGLQPIVDFEVEDTHCYFAGGVLHHNSGKSDAGAYCGAQLARFGTEPLRPAVGSVTVWDRATTGWIVGPDYGTLTQVLLPKYLEWPTIDVPPGVPHRPFIPRREIESWNSQDQQGKLKNGSLIRCKSNEQSQIRFAAAGVDWVHFDEEPAMRNYEEVTLRIEAGRRLRIFGTCTLLPPEGQVGGVSWLFPKIIRPFLNGRRDIGVWGASIYDNPYLDPEEISRLEGRYPEGSPIKRIRLDGEWIAGIGGNQCYLNFRHAIHVKPQDAPVLHAPLCWCIDFNVMPFCSTVGQYLNRRFHVYKEFYLEDGNIDNMVEAFRQAYPAHPHEIWLYGDATGDARHVQSNSSNYTLMQRGMRDYPSALKMNVPAANPYTKDRVNAFNHALRDEHGVSRMEIDPSCVELLADLEQVIADERGGPKKTSNNRDPYFFRTHMSDGVGYWVWKVAPVTTLDRDVQQRLQTHAQATGNPVLRGGQAQRPQVARGPGRAW